MDDLYYDVNGTGDVDIVMVHGWAASHKEWDVILENFGDVARFWRIDHRGFGNSPMGDTPPTVQDHLSTLIRFIEYHDIQPQMMIAHSMGGLITLKLAHIRPDLLQQMVLICPLVTGNYGIGAGASALIRNPLGSVALRSTESLWSIIQHEALLRIFVTPQTVHPSRAERIKWEFMRTHPKAGIEAMISMAQEDMQPVLTDIQHPTLICVGANDLTVPPSEGQTAALYMPHAELHLFDESRHHPHYEQKAEFLRVLRDFFKRHGIS